MEPERTPSAQVHHQSNSSKHHQSVQASLPMDLQYLSSEKHFLTIHLPRNNHLKECKLKFIHSLYANARITFYRKHETARKCQRKHEKADHVKCIITWKSDKTWFHVCYHFEKIISETMSLCRKKGCQILLYKAF